MGESTVIATNTSSLSVTEMAAALERPNRFLGMHFFNPVPASKLVEIVVPAAGDPEVVSSVRDWVGGLAKEPVVVRDSPGFATSRLGVLLGLEAIRMLEEGVADPNPSTGPWDWATVIRWARCAPPTWWVSTSVSPSPTTCTAAR